MLFPNINVGDLCWISSQYHNLQFCGRWVIWTPHTYSHFLFPPFPFFFFTWHQLNLTTEEDKLLAILTSFCMPIPPPFENSMYWNFVNLKITLSAPNSSPKKPQLPTVSLASLLLQACVSATTPFRSHHHFQQVALYIFFFFNTFSYSSSNFPLFQHWYSSGYFIDSINLLSIYRESPAYEWVTSWNLFESRSVCSSEQC